MKKLLLMTSLCVGLLASCSSSSDELIEDMNDPNISTPNTEGLPRNYDWDEIFAKNGVSSRANLPAGHEFFNGSGDKLRAIYMITSSADENSNYKFVSSYEIKDEKSFSTNSYQYTSVEEGFKVLGYNYNHTFFKTKINQNTYKFSNNHTDLFSFTLTVMDDGHVSLRTIDQDRTGLRLSDENFTKPIIDMFGNFRVEAQYEKNGDITNVKYNIKGLDEYVVNATYDKKISEKAPKGLYGLLGFKEYNYPTTLTYKHERNAERTFNFNYHKDSLDRIRMLEVKENSSIVRKFIFFYN